MADQAAGESGGRGDSAKADAQDRQFFAQIDRTLKTPTRDLSQDERDQEKDRELREKFMARMIWILIGQLVVINGALVSLAACGIIEIEEWTLRLWVGGTLLEVFGIVLVIAKYLFPNRDRRSSK